MNRERGGGDMTEWKDATYEPCGHVRHKVGTGEDDGIVIEVWRCDECGNDLIERPPDDRFDGGAG
jgi:hypothetical protein